MESVVCTLVLASVRMCKLCTSLITGTFMHTRPNVQNCRIMVVKLAEKRLGVSDRHVQYYFNDSDLGGGGGGGNIRL